MRGLLLKCWRETRLNTLGFAIAIGVVTYILTYMLPQLMGSLNEFLLDLPFMQSMISAMMGIDISTGLTTTMLVAVMWTHPVVLALVWSHAIGMCSRYPAGEIDRGTIDILLGWPVSRRAVWSAETIVWLVYGAVIVAAALGGYTLASLRLPATARPEFVRALMAAVNLLALYVAAGGITLLASSASSRRGHATVVGFVAVVGSFLLNFLVPYWHVADALSFLGLMEYYRPALILRDGAFPIGNVVVLLTVGIGFWAAGMEVAARRNIATT